MLFSVFWLEIVTWQEICKIKAMENIRQMFNTKKHISKIQNFTKVMFPDFICRCIFGNINLIPNDNKDMLPLWGDIWYMVSVMDQNIEKRFYTNLGSSHHPPKVASSCAHELSIYSWHPNQQKCPINALLFLIYNYSHHIHSSKQYINRGRFCDLLHSYPSKLSYFFGLCIGRDLAF